MTEKEMPFEPDWLSPPGDTIADVLEERGWSQAEFAQRIGYTPKHVNQLLRGKASINEEAALRPGACWAATRAFGCSAKRSIGRPWPDTLNKPSSVRSKLGWLSFPSTI